MNIVEYFFRNKVIPGAMALALAAAGNTASGAGSAAGKGALTPREALEIATDAYVYGYPLVTMDAARRVMTNVRQPEALRAPLGQFARLRTFPTASNHEVSAPNADML